jgi:hypothetical protein
MKTMILSGFKYAVERRVMIQAMTIRSAPSAAARSFTSTSVVKQQEQQGGRQQLADLDHCDLHLVTRYEQRSLYRILGMSADLNLTMNN